MSKTFAYTRCCLCEQQPFLEPKGCPWCGATLREVAREEAERAKWIRENCGVKHYHLELIPKDHVELY
jgi:hypothetical protein